MRPQSIEVFGKYLLLKRLAVGGMAEVFLSRPADRDANGRVLVIKRVLPHIADDPVFLKMFRAEIQVIMGFNHPHTVQLHDFGEVDHQAYIAMEYVEGKDLKQILNKFIEKNERIPIPMALSLITQAASGLNYAHTFENKVTGEALHAIHRDITPHNLILSYDGNLKVIDFGIAKAKGELTERTRTGLIKGKLRYLSPEQVEGQGADERSDIFSLGVVAWELLTLQRPFNRPGDDDQSVLERIRDCEKYLVPPSSVDPEIPQEIDEVIMKALKRNPEERYRSASEFQKALRDILLKIFPTYSYADTAQIVQVLFESEMAAERKELRDVNDLAQSLLNSDNNPFDRAAMPSNKITFPPNPYGVVTQSGLSRPSSVSNQSQSHENSYASNFMQPMVQSMGMPPLPVQSMGQPVAPHIPDFSSFYEVKLEKIKTKKSKSIHFLLLSFYILSIVGIKLDQKYSFVDKIVYSTGIFHRSVASPQHHSSSAPATNNGPIVAPVENSVKLTGGPIPAVARPYQRSLDGRMRIVGAL